MSDSIYKQCSRAVSDLMEGSDVFSEIDVVQLASTPEWSVEDYKDAGRQANQVLGTRYRERKLCRFGPIDLPEGVDYARIASKIAYASVSACLESWDTPNGTFPKLMLEDDEIGHQGRRLGTNRDDSAPMSERRTSDPNNRIQRLEIDLSDLRKRLARLESVEARRQKVYTEA